MKVRYRVPVLDYDEGEVELTKKEEVLFKDGRFLEVLEEINIRLYLDAFELCESAIEFGYAKIEEIKVGKKRFS